MSAYTELKARKETIYRLEHLQSIVTWDRMVNMPAGSAKARAAAQGEFEALVQRMQTDPALDDLLAKAEDETLASADAANLALMRRERLTASAVPEDLLRRRTNAIGAASQAWTKARSENDWGMFAEALAPLLACVRERAERLGDALELSPYDALLDEFDRGLTLEQVKALFAPVTDWLPGLIDSAIAKQANEQIIEPQGPFPVEAQRQVGIAVMTLLGFDFEVGRLDVSAHPFTGGTSEDVRITTRYREDEFFQSLVGIIHETGHARYQAGLPPIWRGQPLGVACSMSMHEGQSLSFEKQLALTPAFATMLSPLLAHAFGPQSAFDPGNLYKLITRVRRGKIRVDADEVTYPAHVLLRSEIEPALIAGEIRVGDIPAWWDERMGRLLDVDTRGDFAGGPLQDIHWSLGMFGYFPSYLIGAMIAAQLNAAYRAATPDHEAREASGDFSGYPVWLDRNIWSAGAQYTTGELVVRATGKPLSADALKAHFERRYL
jgi:carboxypeptidase Taq